MHYFFGRKTELIYFIQTNTGLTGTDIEKLKWLFNNKKQIGEKSIQGLFIGPRKEMITPWSTNAVEITQNMGIKGITRIEKFYPDNADFPFDNMINQRYSGLDEDSLKINKEPDPIRYIDDISSYNIEEGLALSVEEIKYLDDLSSRLGRKLTDTEIFGFSQVNSEHCRHKIFNGTFIIDGEEQPLTLFQLIRKTSNVNHNRIVSAYSDNVAFVEGPAIYQFAPVKPDMPSSFAIKKIDSIISIKAETHNFPTTVEPFNGAATGSGGEIRDRMAGGKGSFPLTGSAVYMTSFTRLEEGRTWEQYTVPRKWLYHDPVELLIKASNGASDFGNKFGQPLINGSILTFEYFADDKKYGYDKVIMLAGGVGYAKRQDSHKDDAIKDENVIVMGGDNYRIGMGGGAVSSVATGEYTNAIELNAVQRSNPEMQKRVYNAIRALAEMDENPIVSIHDHGAGGHLNALSELVETSGGNIDISKLPIGDRTLSYKEILGNESQERMGLLLQDKDLKLLEDISKRERAPLYEAGKTTGDMELLFVDTKADKVPFDLDLLDLFGNPPKSVLKDNTLNRKFPSPEYDLNSIYKYVEDILQMESVACKDWLTNKVDRSVSGRVAMQQNAGIYHLPMNNLGITTLDFEGKSGIASSLGHASVSGLISPGAGSVLSVAEALTNIVWAPLYDGIKGISLSANWMWPAKNSGEDARLYKAVKAISDFAIELGINIPTGKDSLSMKQKYPDGDIVYAPGTVIVSAAGEVTDIKKALKPVLKEVNNSNVLYIDFSGVKSTIDGTAFSILLGKLGNNTATVKDAKYFAKVFDTIQSLIKKDLILAGHDISAGGKITTLLEMTFSTENSGMNLDISSVAEDAIMFLFSENPGIIIQVEKYDEVKNILDSHGIKFVDLGKVTDSALVNIKTKDGEYRFDTGKYRDIWYKTSYLLDSKQTMRGLAKDRFNNYKKQALIYKFPGDYQGKLSSYGLKTIGERKIKAAIIREKGINGDREMAYALYLAGFDVRDIHMTDLVYGRESLEDISMVVFPGGFSNSDVLGSAKGWAGAFLYNDMAKEALRGFYSRKDTLSLGVCNGCQLMGELDLIYPEMEKGPKLLHNDSGKFESGFLTVDIKENNSIMLSSLAGSKLGVWVAHGEGKFTFPTNEESDYNIPLKYAYDSYPGNPNGSQFNAAAICSKDGRHLAMMPHLERAVFPWQWPHYEQNRIDDELSPWIEAFVNARKWLEKKYTY